MNLHAHIESYSSDCDGSYTRTRCEAPNDDERGSEFGDIEFHHRMVANVVNSYAMSDGHQGTLTVTAGYLQWNEDTDEGSNHVNVTFCEDDDTEEESTYRDHRAESMGY